MKDTNNQKTLGIKKFNNNPSRLGKYSLIWNIYPENKVRYHWKVCEINVFLCEASGEISKNK